MKLKNLPVTGKLLLILGLFAAAFLMSGGIVFWSWWQLDRTNQHLVRHCYPVMTACTEVTLDLAEARTELYRYLGGYEPSPYRVEEALARARERLTWMVQQADAPHRQAKLSRLRDQVQAYQEELGKLARAQERGEAVKVGELSNRLLELGTSAAQAASTLKKELGGQVQADLLSAVDSFSGHLRYAALVALGCFGLGLGLIFLISRDLRQGVGFVLSGLQVFSRERREPFPVIDRTDELGSIAGEFHQVARDLLIREADLRESEARYRREQALLRSLLNSMPDIIFFKDQDSVFLGCNPACEGFIGRSEKDIIGLTDLDLFPPEQAEFSRQRDRETLAAGQPRRNEEWIRYPDGRRVLLDMLKTPYYGPEGELLGLIGVGRDITAYRQTEDQLRETLGRLQALMEHLPQGLLLVDENRVIRYVNPMFCRMFGIPGPEAVLGADCAAAAQQAKGLFADPEGFVAGFEARLAARQVVLAEELALADGRVLERDFIPVAIDHRARGHFWIYREITARKKAELALRQAKEDWEATFDAIPDLIMLLDRDHRIRRVNRAMAQALGVAPEAAVGRSCHEAVHGEPEAAPDFCPYSQLLADGQVHEVEVCEPRLGGWYQVKVAPLKDEQGQISGCVHLARDITERRQAEAELRKREERYRTILQTAMDGFCRVDLEGRLLEVNEAYCRMTGYSEQELLAMTLPGLKAVETVAETGAHLQKALFQGEDHFETRHRRRDGSLLDLEVSVQYKPAEGGTFVAFLHDISERRQAEAELARRAAILEAVSQAAGLFLQAGSWEEKVAPVLRALGQAAAASRAYIFENHPGPDGRLLTSQRYEWTGADIEPQIDLPDLQAASYQDLGFGRWVEAMSRGEIIHGLIKDFPASEQAFLASQDIQSLVVVPIFAGGRWWGFMGFDECRSERLWSAAEIEALRAAAGILGSALERARVATALADREARYRAIVDGFDGLIYVCSPDYRIEFMNQRLIERTGYDATGEPCYQVLHERDAVCPWCVNERVFQGETVRWEVQSPKDHRWYYVVNTPIFHSDGRVSKQAMIQDITERKRAEAELQQYREHLEDLVAERTAALAESEARYRTVFEGAPIGIVLRNQDQKVLAMNPAYEKILGYSQEELSQVGRSFLHPEDAPEFNRQFQELAEGRLESFSLENRAYHRDGHLVWRRMQISRLRGKDDQTWFTLGLVQDITAEKHLQAEVAAYQKRLRALAAELTYTEERERRRLAADLHDHIGQVLALVQIKLGAVRQEIASPQAAAPLDEARQLLTGVIGATRSLTQELGIPVLHELGLQAGIEWLGERYREQYGLEVVEDLEPLPASLDDLKKTVLFRAVQELLTNVVKHAQARRVHISLKQQEKELKLMVSDDGLGFDVSDLTAVRGFGLFSIAERVSNLGGHLKLASAPGHGTQVTITFPLDTGSQD